MADANPTADTCNLKKRSFVDRLLQRVAFQTPRLVREDRSQLPSYMAIAFTELLDGPMLVTCYKAADINIKNSQ